MRDRPDCSDTPGLQLVTGWGRTAPTAARVVGVTAPGDLDHLIKEAGRRGLIGRGLGRSYGDAAQNAGGHVAVTTAMDQILHFDPVEGRVRAQAGLSLDELMRALAPLGWWPMVTPGTRQVTLGGAVGSDVHGKNHHRDGSFAAHVDSMVLHTPGFGELTVGPDLEPDIFWATAGGMGLTGLVSEVTLRLLRIETTTMKVRRERTPHLAATLERMVESDQHYRYSVAWFDCLARGRSLGRGVVEFADHATRQDLPVRRRSHRDICAFDPSQRVACPAFVPPGLLNRMTIAAFNELWYRRASSSAREHLVPAASFFHPLDVVGGWNRLYGRRGLVQYQMVVPNGAEDTLRRSIELLASARCPSFLAVLKRFGPSNPGPLSFPQPGWTLALDIPAATPRLARLLDHIDEMVVEAGGRVYLAKDSRLRPDLLRAMYPELPRWQAIRDRLDPERRMMSDLARRLPSLLDPEDPSDRPEARP